VGQVALRHQALGAVLRVSAAARGCVPWQVDEGGRRPQFRRQAQRDPFRAVVAEGKEGAARRRGLTAVAVRLRSAVRGLAEDRHRRPGARILQQRQQGVEAVRAFDQDGGRAQLAQHRLQGQCAGRAVVANRHEVDLAHAQTRQALRDAVHPHRPAAASRKAFQLSSRRARSRTTVSK
jgi:hypothetical protein